MTLLGNACISESRTIVVRHYAHVGSRNAFDGVLGIHGQCDAVHLQLYVNGVSLFKSSGARLWPLLGRLTNPKTAELIVGVLSSQIQPADVTEYFQDLINEVIDAQLHEYYHVGSGKCCIIPFDCLIADAPARALIRQVKQHCGYFSCQNCSVRGIYTGGRNFFARRLLA
ncbi:hypothetical protein EG68_05185 [Paragonimus skrjabini miyazakii]|uniref:Uncharacterized protein n=1 Tax=Paragonimus skrjabini miyazakii TaxID=59628 RepID=A0A8S9YRL1_9TREM|nr:hypothetical protein EG68_05185 [Paragonimus skrjabini miyazakii]